MADGYPDNDNRSALRGQVVQIGYPDIVGVPGRHLVQEVSDLWSDKQRSVHASTDDQRK